MHLYLQAEKSGKKWKNLENSPAPLRSSSNQLSNDISFAKIRLHGEKLCKNEKRPILGTLKAKQVQKN